MFLLTLFHLLNLGLTALALFMSWCLWRYANGERPKIFPWIILSIHGMILFTFFCLRDVGIIIDDSPVFGIEMRLFVNTWVNMLLTQLFGTIAGVSYLHLKEQKLLRSTSGINGSDLLHYEKQAEAMADQMIQKVNGD